METSIAFKCTNGITLAINTEMEEKENCLSVRDKKSYSELGKETLCSSGKSSKIAATDNTALTVRSFGMNRRTKAVSLSDRLTPSLISSGLVKGIIPTWMRRKSSQLTLDFALLQQDGKDVDRQNQDS